MSVNESERGKGKFDVLIKANDLAVYTIRITKNPKIFLPEYQTALTNDIIHTAKEIFTKVLDEKKEPNNYISKDNAQISDKDTLVEIIDTILENNPKQIEDYKNGRTNLFDYFVGQVMKETRGKANPVITKEILKEKL